MGIGNVLALAQVTGYTLSIILFFFIVLPLSKNLRMFSGHCLLYAFGSWENEVYHIDKWGPNATCGFALFMGVFTLFLGIWQTLRLSVHLLKNTDSSFIAAFLTTITNIVVFIMLLGSAGSITAGYHLWCSALENDPPNKHTTCGTAAVISTLWPQKKDFDPSGYPIQIGILQFGMWLTTIVWFLEIFFSSYKLWIYHQQESIFRSLSRERQRLLAAYDPPDM